MSEAKVRWTQRVLGRDEGHVETCEIDTPFMRGCLANLRYEILESYAPAPVNETVQVEVKSSESELMGLTKPKPAPRPNRSETRAPRDKADED